MFNELIINWLCEKIGSVDWETLWALEQNLNRIYILHSWINDPADPSNPSNMMFTWWVKAILDIDRYKVSLGSTRKCAWCLRKVRLHILWGTLHMGLQIYERNFTKIYLLFQNQNRRKWIKGEWMKAQRRGL